MRELPIRIVGTAGDEDRQALADRFAGALFSHYDSLPQEMV